MSYDHLRNQPKSGESGSAGFSRTAILDDLNDAFRRKENADAANRVPHEFVDTDESWADIAAEKESIWLLGGCEPSSTCQLISNAHRDLSRVSSSATQMPSRPQIALVDHVLGMLELLSEENRQECEREWRRFNRQSLKAAVIEAAVLVDPDNRQRVEAVFQSNRPEPSPWLREVFPVAAATTGDVTPADDERRTPRRLGDNSYDPDRFDFNRMIERAK